MITNDLAELMGMFLCSKWLIKDWVTTGRQTDRPTQREYSTAQTDNIGQHRQTEYKGQHRQTDRQSIKDSTDRQSDRE
ncbi:hypothetical protein AC249_AIPGENE3380 [Exaiptasia diaphana]|nr:hypothetical protein AC249_AIPGENE3380 [Exaiptasia diaphana]